MSRGCRAAYVHVGASGVGASGNKEGSVPKKGEDEASLGGLRYMV